MLPAVESGRICAVAGQTQREMRRWAEGYPGLFSAKPFDAALYSTLALATAFSGPSLDSGQQRMANRVTLWCFALDWQVDYVARSALEAAAIARRCVAVAGGANPDPDDELTVLLAEIRDELADAEAYPVLGPIWQDELRRTLDAMGLEHEWKAHPESRPSFEDYLDNAHNLGFSLVLVAHWIHTGRPPSAVDIDDVRVASWAVQRVIRLLNDLATFDRDVQWGDLNVLMLGPDRTEVGRRVTALAAEARERLATLSGRQPALADYMERQMDFCIGFYGVTDYWGSL